MKFDEWKEEISLPEGVETRLDGKTLIVKGPKGEVSKEFPSAHIKIEAGKGSLVLTANNATKREKRMILTYKAHMNNMISGSNEAHHYTLKICSGHFPMNVSVKDGQLIIKNFLGEKVARTIKLRDGVNVRVDGDLIKVESPNKELAGQTAADIEQITRVTNKDRRIFQDGIYIIKKSKR